MIPVNTPLFAGREREYLLECIDTGWISSEGPFVPRFEGAMAGVAGRSYGVAVCNGTAALDIAVEALGLEPGDEVILPTFTIISCVLQIIRAGAVPVVIDADPNTWTMDVTKVEERITPRTRAIMPVHIYGLPVDMDPLLEIAKRHGLAVIEDAAEAHGLLYRGRPCGSFGDMSTFSFYPNKHVTAGEGGMVLTDDPATAESCRSLRNLCFKPEARFEHDRLGWNYRITNMQAAIGLAQIETLSLTLKQKKRMGAMYQERLSDLDCIQLPVSRTEYAENNYWVFGILLRDNCPLTPTEVMYRLREKGIGSRPFFHPLHLQPALHRLSLCLDEEHPVAENLRTRGLYLPSGVALTDAEIDTVSDAVRTILQ